MLHLVKVSQNINDANKTQVAQALVIQAYATSVIRQPKVDFSDDPRLKKHEDTVNEGLTTAQKHARNYLDNIQPKIIKNIASISNCYHLLSELVTTLPEGSTKEEWLESLRAIKKNFEDYKNQAQTVVELVGKLNTELTEDSRAFSKIVIDFNAAVDGDNGVLASDKDELDKIEAQIHKLTVALVVGALGTIGGVVMITIGACASFVTGGAAAALIAGGVVVVAGSVTTIVLSATAIEKLLDQKTAIVSRDSGLKSEVQLASGISSCYQSLAEKITGALKASNDMKNAWESLLFDIVEVISDLENGISTVDKVREMYLAGAKEEIKSLLTDIDIIKEQMAGVDAAIVIAPQGESVGKAAVDAAKKAA